MKLTPAQHEAARAAFARIIREHGIFDAAVMAVEEAMSSKRQITMATTCSGIGSAELAAHRLGWRSLWCSEIEKFPSAVLAHHWPNLPNHGDMLGLRNRICDGQIEAPDVFVAGTPCQAFSLAGLRGGLSDSRGQLTLEFLRIADAIDVVRTASGRSKGVYVWENVPGVLNHPDNPFGCLLGGLAGEIVPLQPPGGRWSNAGCVLGPERAVCWRTLDAQYFGVPQRRRRVFVVACDRDWSGGSTVLFESNGVRRDIAPSRKKGQEVAGTLTARASGGGGGVGRADDAASGYLQVVARCLTAGTGENKPSHSPKINWPPKIAATLNASFGKKLGLDNQHIDGGASLFVPGNPLVMTAYPSVRRLTPRECERLQGFPDDFTRIPWRGKPAEECPDGPRYKAIGNSKAEPCIRFVLGLVQQLIDKNT